MGFIGIDDSALLHPARVAALSLALVLAGCNTQEAKQDLANKAYGALGNPTSGLAYATAMPSASAEESIARGDIAIARGDEERALFEYLQALQLGGANAAVLYKVGKIHLRRNDRRRAELAFDMALRDQPDHAGANLELGILRVHRRDYETARSHLLRSIQLVDSNPNAHNALGVMEDMRGDHKAAQGHYQAAIATAKYEPVYRNNLGYSYYLDGNPILAEKWFKESLTLDPSYQRAWRNLGLIYARSARYQEALEAFGKVEDLHEAYNDVGYIAMVSGRYDEAQLFFEEAIRLSPMYYELAGKNAERLTVLRHTGSALK